jgi:hypothetical protein
MNDEIAKPSSTDIELAKMLGARQAFGLVAGRCTAADAAILRDIRDNKKYLGFSPSWNDFCEQHLRMSKGHANHLIRQLNELGPAYFTLAQLTRITPDEFRALGPAVRGNALEFRGEAIALIEENAGRLTEAVGALRQAGEPEAPDARPPARSKLDRIQRTVEKSLRSLEQLARDPAARPEANIVLYRLGREIRRLEEACAGRR